MHAYTSFPASAVDPDELNAILSDYLALERVRIFRHLLVKRFGLLTVIAAAVSLTWLSRFAFWFSVSVCLTPPVWALIVEIRRERRLATRLNNLPDHQTTVFRGSEGRAGSTEPRKVIKSS